MDTVTTRVTENIRQELDLRFARFEKVFESMAAAEPTPRPASPPKNNKRPAEGNSHSDDSSSKVVVGEDDCSIQQPSQSSFHPFSVPNKPAPAQTLTQRDLREAARPSFAQAQPQPASGINVNNNNPSPTWNAWLAMQQPFASTFQPESPGNDNEQYNRSIEHQVRQIMEGTPHQLKGKVPIGYFPYKYVTRGPAKTKLGYNSVSLAEHIYGMFRMMDDVNTDPTIKPHLLTHMKEVVEDASEFEWASHVRRWSEEVFTQVVERRLPRGWESTDRIQNLRTGMSRVDSARLQSGKEAVQKKFAPQHQGNEALRGGPPCVSFNSAGGCSLQSGHLLQGIKQVHVCAYCLNNTAAAHPHSEARCRTKQRHAASHF